MKKKYLISFCICANFLCIVSYGFSTVTGPIISLGGLVQSPMRFSMQDLSHFRKVSITLNITADETGNKKKTAVKYSGIQLRTLLELEKIQKYEFENSYKTDNKVPTVWRMDSIHKIKSLQDIAVSVKNTQGKQIVLSWGEIFLQNEDDIIVAVCNESVGADKKIRQNSSVFELVFKHDLKRERVLTNVNSIDVIRAEPIFKEDFNDNQEPYILTVNSEKFTLTEIYSKSQKIKISSADIKAISDYKESSYNGVPLKAVFDKLISIKPGYTVIAKIVSRQGDVTAVSYGELQTSKGRRIILTEGNTPGNKSVNEIIFPDDESCCRKKHPGVSDEEAEKAAKEIYKRDMEMIRAALDEGKIIVLLEPGDPTLFGGWRNWLSPNFPKETIKVVTGISSFNAANAMLGEINLTNGSVIITEPESLRVNESLIQSAALSGDVIVIFMGLGRMKDLLPQFNKYYAKDTPVYLIYFAGIADKECKIKTTLEKAVKDINSNNENFLGLIYIGKNLDSMQNSENTRKFISEKWKD